jgi:hypothetical protein
VTRSVRSVQARRSGQSLGKLIFSPSRARTRLHELLQSDILNGWRLSRRAVPNWGRAYHGNATKHRKETDVEGTHDSAKVWFSIVRRNTHEMRGGIPGPKTVSAEGFKLLDRLLGDKVGQHGRTDHVI